MTAMPPKINFPAISRYYAAGGPFNTSNTSVQESDTVLRNLAEVVSELKASNMQLLILAESLRSTVADLRSNGIKAYTVLTDQEKQQARLDAIRDDATLK